MLIKGLQKHTLLDYPGKIACTIFLFGCNFRCPYCHNPELVDAKLAKELKTYTEEEISQFLGERKGFLEGVCITGGEPTLNPDLPDFIKKIKQLGYKVKLDTNGTNPEMLEKLKKEKTVDYVAMDFKAPLKNYERVVNAKVNLEYLRKSINIIKSFSYYEFRITVVPKLTSKQDLLEIAKYLKKQKANKKFFLQEFRAKKCLDKSFEKEKPYSEKELREFLILLKPYFKNVKIRSETY
jgi:pyruvate formate lyase activating enzyme